MHYLCLRSCLERNAPDAIHLHYVHEPWGELWDAIRPHLTLRPLEGALPLSGYRYAEGSSSAAYGYAHASDFLRVDILQREGGVYADMDTLFLHPLPDVLFENQYVMGHETVDTTAAAAILGGSLCNAFLMAEAGSEFGALWYDKMSAHFDGSWSRHSTFLPYELSVQHPQIIHVEPQSSFFSLDWTAEGIARIFERFETFQEEVYSLHLWAHLWWSESRVDISRFHQGRLTTEYVAHAETTYAHYARTLLPAGAKTGSATAYRLQRSAQKADDLSRNIAGAVRRRVARLWKSQTR